MVETKTLDEGRLFWSSRLETFRNAEYRFSSLERLANQTLDGNVAITSNDLPHMLAAAFAVAKLERLGKEQLLAFEQTQIVHPSTISGGSLHVAYAIVQGFLLHGEDRLNRDQYEQLFRVCYSARHLYEEGYF